MIFKEFFHYKTEIETHFLCDKTMPKKKGDQTTRGKKINENAFGLLTVSGNRLNYDNVGRKTIQQLTPVGFARKFFIFPDETNMHTVRCWWFKAVPTAIINLFIYFNLHYTSPY